MEEKEPLRKKVARQIASPLMVIGIGTTSVMGGMVDAAVSLYSKDKKVEQMLPPIASPEKLEEAKKEILIFDNTVHNIIVSGKSTIDIAQIADQSRLTESIKLIDQEKLRDKQRHELRASATNQIFSRDIPIAIGGLFLFLGGSAWDQIRLRKEERERRSQNASPRPTNT